MEIWQTTNQQPWVEAVLSGLTTVKTRTSKPVVPIGAFVLLHASKTMWPEWRNLSWAEPWDPSKLNLGMVVGVARTCSVAPSEMLMTTRERKVFDVPWGNCAAYWGVKFDRIHRLPKPVPAKGFQAPFARARPETVRAVLRSNPGVRDWIPFRMERLRVG